MERVSDQRTADDEAAADQVSVRVRTLLQELRWSETPLKLIEQIDDVLAKATPSESLVKVLFAALDDESLRTVRTPAGHSVHTPILERLVQFGYPWALRVLPEHFDVARAERRRVLLRSGAVHALGLVNGFIWAWLISHAF